MAAQMTNMTDMAGMLLNAATAASKPTTGTAALCASCAVAQAQGQGGELLRSSVGLRLHFTWEAVCVVVRPVIRRDVHVRSVDPGSELGSERASVRRLVVR